MDPPDLPSFACGMCGKLFSDAEQMRLHIQMHTGQQPFRCVICWPLFYNMSNEEASQPSSSSQPLNSSGATACKPVTTVSSQEASPPQVIAANKDRPTLPAQLAPSASNTTVNTSDVLITPSSRSSAVDESPVLESQIVVAADVDSKDFSDLTEVKMSERWNVMDKSRIKPVTTSCDKEVLMRADKSLDLQSQKDTDVSINSEVSSVLKTNVGFTVTAAECVVDRPEIKTVITSTEKEVLTSVSQEETNTAQKQLHKNTLRAVSAADKEFVRGVVTHKEDTVTNKEIKFVEKAEDVVIDRKVNQTGTTQKKNVVENKVEEEGLVHVVLKEETVRPVQELAASVIASKETPLPFNQNDTDVETAPNTQVTRMQDEALMCTVARESANEMLKGKTQKDAGVTSASLNSSVSTVVGVLSQDGAVCSSGSQFSYENTVHTSTPPVTDPSMYENNWRVPKSGTTSSNIQNSTLVTLNTRVSGFQTPPVQSASIQAPIIANLDCIQFSLEELVSAADFAEQQQITELVENKCKTHSPDQIYSDHSYGLDKASSSQKCFLSSVCTQSTPAAAVPLDSLAHRGRRRKVRPKKLAHEVSCPTSVAERLRQEAAIRNDHIYSNQFREDKSEFIDHKRTSQSLNDVSLHSESKYSDLETRHQVCNNKNHENNLKDSDSSLVVSQQPGTLEIYQDKALPSEFHTKTTPQGFQEKTHISEEKSSALDRARVKDTPLNFQGIISFLKKVQIKSTGYSKNSEGNNIKRIEDNSGQPSKPVATPVTTQSPDDKSRHPRSSVIETYTATVPSSDSESKDSETAVIETFTLTSVSPDSTTRPFGSGIEEESRVLDTLDNCRTTNSSENAPGQELRSSMVMAPTSRRGLAEEQFKVEALPESSKEETLCDRECVKGSKVQSLGDQVINTPNESTFQTDSQVSSTRATARQDRLTQESIQQRTLQFVQDRNVTPTCDANMQASSKGRAAPSIIETRNSTKRMAAKRIEEIKSKTDSPTKWQTLMADVSPSPSISIPAADTSDAVKLMSADEPLFVTENAAVPILTSGVGVMTQKSAVHQSAVVSSSDSALVSAAVLKKAASVDVSTSVVRPCTIFAKNEDITQAETQSTKKTIHRKKVLDRINKIPSETCLKRPIEVTGAANSKSPVKNVSPINENVKTIQILPGSVSRNPSVLVHRMSDSVLKDLRLGKTIKASLIESFQEKPFMISAHVDGPYRSPAQPLDLACSENTDEDENDNQEISDSDRTLLYGDEEDMSDCWLSPPKLVATSSPGRKCTQQAKDTNLRTLSILSQNRSAEQKQSHKNTNKTTRNLCSEKSIQKSETEQEKHQQSHQNVTLVSQMSQGLSAEQNGFIKTWQLPRGHNPKNTEPSTISGIKSITLENYIAENQITSEEDNIDIQRYTRKKAVQKRGGERTHQTIDGQVEKGNWPQPNQNTLNTCSHSGKDGADVQYRNKEGGHSQKDSRIVTDRLQRAVVSKQNKHAQKKEQIVIAEASSNSQKSNCSRKRISKTSDKQHTKRTRLHGLDVEKHIEAYSDHQDAPTLVQRSSRNVSFDSSENSINTLSVSSDRNIDGCSEGPSLDSRENSLDVTGNQSALFKVRHSDGKMLETAVLLAIDTAQQEVLNAVHQGSLTNLEASVARFCTNLYEKPAEESVECVDLPEISKPRRTRAKGKSSEYYWRSRHEKTKAIMTGNGQEEHSPLVSSMTEECAESLSVPSRAGLKNGVNVMHSLPQSAQQDNLNSSSCAVTSECDEPIVLKEEPPLSNGNYQAEVVQETEESNFQIMKTEIVGSELIMQLKSPEMFPLSVTKSAAGSETPVQCILSEVCTPSVTESNVDRETPVQNRSPEIFAASVAESVKRAATRRKATLQPLNYTDKTSVKASGGISDNVLSVISSDPTNGQEQKVKKVLKRKKDALSRARVKQKASETQKPREKQKGFHPRKSLHIRPDGNELGKIVSMPCSMCGARFKKYAKYVSHLRTGCKERFECDICGKSYGRKETLKIHKRSHTGEAAVNCDICGKRLCGRHSLVTHMRIHTDERPYKCPICDVSFRQPSALSSHYRTHTQDRPYKCDICGKRYRFNKNLYSHRLTHTGERPYVCPVCNSGFVQVSGLIAHLRQHKGERPFPCDYCVTRFEQKEQLLKHIRHIHPHKVRELEYKKAKDEGKPYLCALCNRGFRSAFCMRRHMKSFCFLLDKSSIE